MVINDDRNIFILFSAKKNVCSTLNNCEYCIKHLIRVMMMNSCGADRVAFPSHPSMIICGIIMGIFAHLKIVLLYIA